MALLAGPMALAQGNSKLANLKPRLDALKAFAEKLPPRHRNTLSGAVQNLISFAESLDRMPASLNNAASHASGHATTSSGGGNSNVVQVSDASSPLSVEQDAPVELVLQELEADKKPRIRAMNKIDLLPALQRESLRDDARTVHISAVKGIGLSALLERIDEMIEEDQVSRVHLRVPQKEGKALALLQARARIYSRQYKDGMVEVEAEAPESVVRRVREWVVK